MKYVDDEFNKFKKSAQKGVNYLVKEFEMKKSADAYARTAVSRTGVLDTSKLHTYKFNEDIFRKINDNKVDILIGTQMISKGFNFPKLNCIVVIDADFSGRGYDLRTTEKNIQLYCLEKYSIGRLFF